MAKQEVKYVAPGMFEVVQDGEVFFVNVGDIGFVEGRSFIAKGIQLAMRIARKLRGLSRKKHNPNHTFHFVEFEKELYVSEARAKGAQIKKYIDTYLGKRDYYIKTPVKHLTEEEKRRFTMIAAEVCFRPTGYDFVSLLIYQVWYVLTGRWVGKTGHAARRRIYCTEYTAYVWNKLKGYFREWWKMNPLDLDISDKFRLLIDLRR